MDLAEKLEILADSAKYDVACTAISAVSSSRISPIMIISGSCRKIERSADANVISALAFTCT